MSALMSWPVLQKSFKNRQPERSAVAAPQFEIWSVGRGMGIEEGGVAQQQAIPNMKMLKWHVATWNC